jgi:prepilin-type N-terminal cleavage/methylation domain-containing protein
MEGVLMNLKTDNFGYSLIEIIFAMSIFAIVAASLLFALTNADKIKASGSTVESVTTLARNETEAIKNTAFVNAPLNDTVYDIVYNKKEYTVERKRIIDGEMDVFESNDEKSTLQELVIIISEKSKPDKKWTFNLVQGFTN